MKWLERLVLMLVVMALGVGVSEAWRIWRGDVATLEARAMSMRWADGQAWTVTDWLDARDQFLDGLRYTPDNPMQHDYLASLYALRGYQVRDDPSLRQEYFDQALRQQRESLRLRPQHGMAWANLSRYLVEVAPTSADVWQAWQASRQWAPYELMAQSLRADVALMAYPDAPPPVRQWLQSYAQSTWPLEQDRLRRLSRTLGREQVLAQALPPAPADDAREMR